MDIDETIRRLESAIDSLLPEKRASHSRRVADTAAALCARFGGDLRKARLAGLAHDMCRGLPLHAQRELADRLGRGPRGEFLTSQLREDPELADSIVHGPAAAQYLKEEFGIEDQDIVEAVALHSLGDPAMCHLATLVFVADKTEPGRGRPAPNASELCPTIESLLCGCIGSTVGWLEARGDPVARRSLRLYNALNLETSKR